MIRASTPQSSRRPRTTRRRASSTAPASTIATSSAVISDGRPSLPPAAFGATVRDSGTGSRAEPAWIAPAPREAIVSDARLDGVAATPTGPWGRAVTRAEAGRTSGSRIPEAWRDVGALVHVTAARPAVSTT